MTRGRGLSGPKWAFLLVPLLLLAGDLGRAAAPPDGGLQPATGPAWLTGQFLVASPLMGDPNFAETVICMVRHDETGAMGLVINRPLGQAPLGPLLEKLGQGPVATHDRIRIYVGGPVEPQHGFVLHSTDVLLPGSSPITGDLALTASPEMLRALAEGKGPKDAIFLLGYAGWGPGQLEAEIAEGAWESIAPDAALVFDEPDDSRWKQALGRHGIDL